MSKSLNSREIALSAGLAAISAIVQLVHLGYQSPQWGMWIDVVAVSWLVAYFLFGVRSAFLVSLMGGLIITLFAPETWLGAVMKWVATLPMWFSLYIWIKFRKKDISSYQNIRELVVPLVFALVIRTILMLPLNYYFAIPIWTGMTTQQAISIIPWYIISIFNSVQGIFDVILAWLVVFHFRIYRFASWRK